jgi:hypothetical protein
MYAMIQKKYAKKYRNVKEYRFGLEAFLFMALIISGLHGQIAQGVYVAQENTADGLRQHEIKTADGYLVYTVYMNSPPDFIKTFGGHYSIDNTGLHLEMEFNSQFEKDSLKTLDLPLQIEHNKLLWGEGGGLQFTAVESNTQPLDGLWLFAARGPDTGQERRGEHNSRKTLKVLIDGHFQWIAYDTADMSFSGTGGGRYEARNGSYIEHIGYFSRDNSRVGATLDFNFELEGSDWHHRGTNSRGEPMYEIWAKRKSGG